MDKLNYQEKIVNEALEKLNSEHKVGLNVFTRGGKSYIAMNIMKQLITSNSDKILVIGPKNVVSNLQINVMNDFEYYDRIIWLNYEKLSRKVRITDYLSRVGINPDDIKVILMDEAHKAFGRVRRETFVDDSEWIYSKYLIAMTATEYNNLSGIHALYELVGKDNIIEYNHVDAIKDGVARKVKYIPAVLSYDKSVIDKINQLKKLNIKSKVTLDLIKKLEKKYKELSSDEANLIRDYLVENTALSLKNGARVFVFFSKIEAIKEHEDAIIEAVTSAYRAWGNRGVKYRCMELTSDKSEKETNEIRSTLGDDPLPHTVDIIFAVNMADEGIHPSRTHFALMMSATSSIQKLQQRIGRVTNLCEYDDTDTLIFDLRDSIGIINKVKYTNRVYESIRDIIVNTYDDVETTDDTSILGDYTQVVDIIESKTAENALELVNKLRFIEEATRDAASVIEYIQDYTDEIDTKLNGDVLEFLRRKRVYGFKYYERQTVLGKETKYRALLNIAFSNEYDEEVQSVVKALLRKLGYRIYIKEGTFDDIRSCNRVKIIYNECDKSANNEEITDKLINIMTFNKLNDNERRILIDFDIDSLYEEAKSSGRVEKVTQEKLARDEIKRAKKEEALRQREERERQAKLKQLQVEREEYIKTKLEKCVNNVDKLEKLKRRCSKILDKIDMLKEEKHESHYVLYINTYRYKSDLLEVHLRADYIYYTSMSIEDLGNFTKLVNDIIKTINDKIATSNEYINNLRSEITTDISIEGYKDRLDSIANDIENISIGINETSRDILELKRSMSQNPLDSELWRKKEAWRKEYVCSITEFREILRQSCNTKMACSKSHGVKSIARIDESKINELLTKLEAASEKAKDIEKSQETSSNENESGKKERKINVNMKKLMPHILSTCGTDDENKAAAVIAILKYGILLDVIQGRLSVSNASNNDIDECDIVLRDKFGNDKADCILEEASKWLENAESKLLLNILSGDIYTDSIDGILSELSTIQRVSDSKDSIDSSILEVFRVENLYSRYLKTLRASKGFSVYTKLIYTKSFNNEVSTIIEKMLEDEIRNNIKLVLYYAFKTDDKTVYNELANNKKYHKQLKNYIKACQDKDNTTGNEYCQFIKDMIKIK